MSDGRRKRNFGPKTMLLSFLEALEMHLKLFFSIIWSPRRARTPEVLMVTQALRLNFRLVITYAYMNENRSLNQEF